MKMDSRFASRAGTVDDIAEPFRKQLKAHLRQMEEAALLVCAPAHATLRERNPATVLAVTDQRWLIVAETLPGVTRVEGASFDETLLVEFTEILLYGEMRLHFVLDGRPHSSAAHFNTVMDKFYREATRLVLDGIEGVFQVQNREISTEVSVLSDLTFKFRNAVTEHVPLGRHILQAVQWPTVIGGFRRELGPAGVLTLTDRELIVITEDKRRRWFESKKGPRHASIATYVPLVNLAGHQISAHSKFCLLELQTHVRKGAEVVEILFPVGHKSKINECMERAAAAMSAIRDNDRAGAHPACKVSFAS